jgi:hypothetical protein
MDRYNPLNMHVALKRLTVYERPSIMLYLSFIKWQKIATILHYRVIDNKELQRWINQSTIAAISSPLKFFN